MPFLPTLCYLRMLKTLPEQAFLFHYKEEPTADVIEDVHSQAADLGVIFLKEKNEALTREYFKAKRLICARVFDTRLHLIVRCGHPLTEKADFTLEDLYSWGLVMYYTKKEAKIYSLEDGYYNKASLSDLIFWPAPNVDSALVLFRRHPAGAAPADRAGVSRETVFRLVDAAFGQRRKTLHAALKKIVPPEAYDRAGIDATRRGETLSIDEFVQLAAALEGARA